MKKAIKTIEEGWNKKGSPKPDVGKYQTPPKKPVTTFPKKPAVPATIPNTQPKMSPVVVCEDKDDVFKKPKTFKTSEETSKHDRQNQTNVPTETKQKENVDTSFITQLQKPTPPSYRSKEMIADLARKQFQTASMQTCMHSTLASSQYLNELYNYQAKKSLNSNYLESFKENRSGLHNLGVSCWFNAVVQLFCNSVFMKDINEHFVTDLSFQTELRNVLLVFHRTALGHEVPRGHLRKAMIDLHEQYNINTKRQNDAHEFVSTAIFNLMSITGRASVIEIQEAVGCSNCGYRSIKDCNHNDIQLRVPSTEIKDCANITDLLDDYFSGEKIESTTDDMLCVDAYATDTDKLNFQLTDKDNTNTDACCNKPSLWKSVTVSHLPTDLVLTISRYVYKNNRIGKTRKPIYINTILNLEKYTTSGIEHIYRLKGVVIHHGNSPTSGHYTCVDTDGQHKILIDDEHFSFYNGTDLFTDSYILLYEMLQPDISFPPVMPKFVSALSVANGLSLGTERYLPDNMITIRKRQIIDLFEDVNISDEVPCLQMLCKLLQDGMNVSQLPMNTRTAVLISVLQYMLGENTGVIKKSIGVSYLKVRKCLSCLFVRIQDCYDILYPPSMDNAVFQKCSSCQSGEVEETFVIYHLGHTIVMSNFSQFATEIELQNSLQTLQFFQPLKKLQVKWTAFISAGNDLVINNSRTDANNSYKLLNEYGKYVTVQQDQFENILIPENTERSDISFLFINIDIFELKNEYKRTRADPSFGDDWSSLEVTVSQADQNLCDHFDIAMKIGNFNLTDEDVQRFMGSEYTDKNIDSYLQTQKLTHKDQLFVFAAWYASQLDASSRNIMYSDTTWFDKRMIFLPVNIDGRHWILISVDPSSKTVYYLDPLADSMNPRLVDRIVSFFQFQYFAEKGSQMPNGCNIINLHDTGLFPTQTDLTSCGAFVCLYVVMIANELFYSGPTLTPRTVRQYIFGDLLDTFYKTSDKDIFGLKDVIRTPDLDTIVHAICTGNQPTNERHSTFLRSPIQMKKKALSGFGENYFSTEDFYLLSSHLIKRYFKSSSSMFIICKTSVFKDADVLNNFVAKNLNHVQWYVDCVLTKEVLVALLAERLTMDTDDVNAASISTEFSTYEYLITEVTIARQAKQKMKAMAD